MSPFSYSYVFRSVSRRRSVLSGLRMRFVADEPPSSIWLADEPSTNAVFAPSTNGKIDLALALLVTKIEPQGSKFHQKESERVLGY